LIEDAKLKRKGRIEPESFVEAFLDEIEKNGGKKEGTGITGGKNKTISIFNFEL